MLRLLNLRVSTFGRESETLDFLKLFATVIIMTRNPHTESYTRPEYGSSNSAINFTNEGGV